MSPSKPSVRVIAIVGLLLVGGVCSFAFHAAMSDMEITYTATPVEPGDDPGRVADASRSIGNLDDRLAGKPSTVRQPVNQAVRTGSFEGDVPPELEIILDDLNATYVVYNDSYYRWNLTADEETTYLSIEISPVKAEAVITDVSAPSETAPSEIQSAIESGSSTGWSVETGVYLDDGAYYAVTPESDSAVATSILGGFVGYLVTPVGRGYLAVALGLLGYWYREPLADRVLTAHRSILVASLAVPVALVGTALFESGSISRFITAPVSATVVSSGVVAGTLAHQRRWAGLIGATVLVTGLTIGVSILAYGLFGILLGGIFLIVGFSTGVVSFVYGYVFARRPSQAVASTRDSCEER
jgi:hypothetical protein